MDQDSKGLEVHQCPELTLLSIRRYMRSVLDLKQDDVFCVAYDKYTYKKQDLQLSEKQLIEDLLSSNDESDYIIANEILIKYEANYK